MGPSSLIHAPKGTHKLNTTRLLVRAALCAALSLSVSPKAHAQFTYTFFPNNGAIDSAVNTDFAIVGYAGGSYDDNFNRNFQSPSSPTVNVIKNANIIGEMDVFNSSTVNLYGGSIGFLSAFDNSTVNVSGGSSPFLLTFDHSTVHMSHGNIDDLECQGNRVKISSGNISSKLLANSATNSRSDVLGSCIVDVTGGSINGQLDAYNSGILNLYGGHFGGDLYAAFGGTINVFGSDLTTSLSILTITTLTVSIPFPACWQMEPCSTTRTSSS